MPNLQIIQRYQTKGRSYLTASNWHGNNQLLFACFLVYNTHRIISTASIFTDSDATFSDQILACRRRTSQKQQNFKYLHSATWLDWDFNLLIRQTPIYKTYFEQSYEFVNFVGLLFAIWNFPRICACICNASAVIIYRGRVSIEILASLLGRKGRRRLCLTLTAANGALLK